MKTHTCSAAATALACLGAWLGSNTSSFAADYRLESFTIAGGGGISSSGSFALVGTIGQSEGGTLQGGAFNLEGGFWPGVNVQAPGAPTLKIQLSGDGRVVLSWPLNASGYELEQSSSFSGAWSPALVPVIDTGTEHTVTIWLSDTMRSYRLKKSQP